MSAPERASEHAPERCAGKSKLPFLNTLMHSASPGCRLQRLASSSNMGPLTVSDSFLTSGAACANHSSQSPRRLHESIWSERGRNNGQDDLSPTAAFSKALMIPSLCCIASSADRFAIQPIADLTLSGTLTCKEQRSARTINWATQVEPPLQMDQGDQVPPMRIAAFVSLLA